MRCVTARHEPKFLVFALEEDRAITRGDFRCFWCAGGGDMNRPVAKDRILGCDGCGVRVPCVV